MIYIYKLWYQQEEADSGFWIYTVRHGLKEFILYFKIYIRKFPFFAKIRDPPHEIKCEVIASWYL